MLEIKKTKSLSPVSCRVIDARVVLEEGRVFLVKQDEDGRTYKTLIEQDYEFYRRMTAESPAEQVEPSIIFLYASDRCNLNCSVCFEKGQSHPEISLDEMERLCRRLRHKSIVLMGKEPTCRPDLFAMIRQAGRHSRVILTTNGIKLADYDYVAGLKRAGLSIISLTFYGFDDNIYQRLNNRPLAALKLKALENIKKVGLRTTLSISLIRGLNDDQIKKMVDYCFDNRSFIYQLRIRTAQKIGACPEVAPFTMSELLGLFAESLHIPLADILKEHLFWKEVLGAMGPLAPPKVLAIVRTRLCAYSVTIMRDKNGYTCLGSHLPVDQLKNGKWRTVSRMAAFLKTVGPAYLADYICAVMGIPAFQSGKSRCLMVGFRCWPNIGNIDLCENRKCPSVYYKHGQLIPFCYSNIIEAARGRQTGGDG